MKEIRKRKIRIARKRPEVTSVVPRQGSIAGFTLIESVIALGLFVSVVLLLIVVFGELLSDDFPSRSNKAFALAQSELAMEEMRPTLVASETDTLGFLVVRKLKFVAGMPVFDVTVSSGINASNILAELTEVYPSCEK